MNEHKRNLDTWNDCQDDDGLLHWPDDFTDEDAQDEAEADYGERCVYCGGPPCTRINCVWEGQS